MIISESMTRCCTIVYDIMSGCVHFVDKKEEDPGKPNQKTKQPGTVYVLRDKYPSVLTVSALRF